jgi:hypothetical protein
MERQARGKRIELITENAALRQELAALRQELAKYLGWAICTAQHFSWDCTTEKARLEQLKHE